MDHLGNSRMKIQGRIVLERYTGIKGIALNSNKKIKGQVVIQSLEDGQKYLCDEENLSVIGFVN